MKRNEQPMQPVIRDKYRCIRFKENKIVSLLLNFASTKGMSLNEIARLDVDVEDRIQFAQLIGYSLSGFDELNYVHDRASKRAKRKAKKLFPST